QSNDNQETGAFDAKIEGAVSYRDKSTIPPSSIIKVALLDLSAGEPKVINQAEYRAGETSVPYAFSIPYNKSAINPEGTYALNGEISFAGQNLYYTLKPIEVINTTLKNNVALILVKGPKPNN
ncbi:MAG: YbaY family lipoprotein, partial [Bacteroidota bacterium]